MKATGFLAGTVTAKPGHRASAFFVQGELVMDLERTNTEFHQGQADFLNRELNACSLYLHLAYKSNEQEDKASAAQARAYAETGYATVLRLMSDPQCVKSLTVEVENDFKQQMEVIRKALDGLQCKEMDRPSKAS